VKLSISSTSHDLSQTSAFSSFDFANAKLDSKGRRMKLELAVCQRIIEHMGGTIDISSAYDKGDGEISLNIPFKEPSASKLEQLVNQRINEKSSTTSIFKKTFNGIHVLLAEDDPINQSLAVAFLTKLGGSIDTADNGKEALEKFQNNDYDIVLLDCDMPVMNGFDAAVAIRSFEKESKNGHKTPIIAMTAYAARGDRDNCLAAGMDDHVPKPITLDLLASIAENHIFQNR
jgi:CheY-like chemotaxis protein